MKAATSVPLAALRAAFPYTVPILAGFLFLGLAYGIYTNVSYKRANSFGKFLI